MSTRELRPLTSPRRAAGEIRATGWRRPPASRRPARAACRPPSNLRGTGHEESGYTPRHRHLAQKKRTKMWRPPARRSGRRRARGESSSSPESAGSLGRDSGGAEGKEGRKGGLADERGRAGVGRWGATVSETGRAWGARPGAVGGKAYIYIWRGHPCA